MHRTNVIILIALATKTFAYKRIVNFTQTSSHRLLNILVEQILEAAPSLSNASLGKSGHLAVRGRARGQLPVKAQLHQFPFAMTSSRSYSFADAQRFPHVARLHTTSSRRDRQQLGAENEAVEAGEVVDGEANDARTVAVRWNSMAVDGWGIVDGRNYSQLECVLEALGADPSYSKAWRNLGILGGGTVGGVEYDPNQCYQKAVSCDADDKESMRSMVMNQMKNAPPL